MADTRINPWRNEDSRNTHPQFVELELAHVVVRGNGGLWLNVVIKTAVFVV